MKTARAIATANTLYLSAGIDYNASHGGRYEYCVFLGEELIARGNGFKTKKAAIKAGLAKGELIATIAEGK
jgi:hypothetical protein